MRILLAIDTDEYAERTVRAISPWAANAGAEVYLFTVLSKHDVQEVDRPSGFDVHRPAGTVSGSVIDMPEPALEAEVDDFQTSEQAKEGKEAEVEAFQRDLAARFLPGVDCRFDSLVENDVTDAILSMAAALEVDFLAMSTHGRTGLTHLLMGSVAEDVVRRAICPVLLTGPQALLAPAG